jgi:hypothetical protein
MQARTLKNYSACALALACSIYQVTTASAADSDSLFDGGHIKYAYENTQLPEDSLFRDYEDSPLQDHIGSVRLKFSERIDRVKLSADYQLLAAHGDRLSLIRRTQGGQAGFIDDRYRLMDLTHVFSEDTNEVIAHRLDRLAIDVSTENQFLRIGRQAISWGNGMFYNTMDLFNPFDPAAVDREYKTGDDMLYAQQLLHSGDDIQAVWVVRRDDKGEVTSEVDSIAVKYHMFSGEREFDLLVSQHYDDTVLAFGSLSNVGEAVWRGDISYTDTDTDDVFSLVTSLSYSWYAMNRNMSGVIEYFYNGFGLTSDEFESGNIAGHPELLERIDRGELYTYGRHYVAASLLIEMTPLWQLTPNLFINAGDGSLLSQLVSSYDLRQDMQLLAAASLPTGPAGTEFGGANSPIPGKQLSTGFSMFAQLAWYF